MLILLISFLSGCQVPTIADQIQCAVNISITEENGRRYINENESTCACRMYRWNSGYIGPVGVGWEEDITYCNKFIGLSPDGYQNKYIYEEDIREEYNKWLRSDKDK
jgi:hypothetical protein